MGHLPMTGKVGHPCNRCGKNSGSKTVLCLACQKQIGHKGALR